MKYLFCSMEIMTFLSEILNNAHNKHLILISNRSYSQKYLLTQDFNKMPNLDQKLARRLQIQLLKTETQDHIVLHNISRYISFPLKNQLAKLQLTLTSQIRITLREIFRQTRFRFILNVSVDIQTGRTSSICIHTTSPYSLTNGKHRL